MSPVSRGRKGGKSRGSDQRVLRVVPAAPQECDCPACSGEQFDPATLLGDLTADAAVLRTVEDPLEVELFGASFLAVGELAGEDFAEAFSLALIPALAQSPTPESLAVLLALDAVGGEAAAEPARQLLGAGLPAPGWLAELSVPATVGICRRYADQSDEASMLLVSFARAGRSHGFLVHVDHLECYAAEDIILFPGEVLDEVTKAIKADSRSAGVELTVEDLDPAELRWQLERALDARAVHDEEVDEPDLDSGDDDGPGYHPLAALLRARLRTLPEPPRPPAEHGSEGRSRSLAQFSQPAGGRRQSAGPKLPPKRKKSAGPAPIYRIKVSLRGAKPPIWRRLELPGDVSLAELHRILQLAFGWDDSHMHAFETPSGAFGVADRELGHRAEAPVTLEQVAPQPGDKVRYLYDFGDCWEHEIVVEKFVDRQPVTYPRCTGGRRAAPPEDCGGIWGYEALVEALSDPSHPDHDEQLDWLGLKSADDFQPAQFDAAAVTRLLTGRG